jgi:hypothetical protein
MKKLFWKLMKSYDFARKYEERLCSYIGHSIFFMNVAQINKAKMDFHALKNFSKEPN